MKICVVYKRSFFELNKITFKRIKNKTYKNKILKSHSENKKTIETVKKAIKEARIHHKIIYRASLRKIKFVKGFDLIIAVGGDGTLFESARHAGSTPLMLVNSDIINSVGYFSSANRFNFNKVFKRYLEGKLRKIKLPCLSIIINGKLVEDRVLNDVLFTNQIPSLSTKYILKYGKFRETQKSSGIWIATPSGSTGAIKSAGGKKMKITARSLQYLVREPLNQNSLKFINGIVGKKIEIISSTRKAMLFVDGILNTIPVNVGDKIEVSISKNYFELIGFSKDK